MHQTLETNILEQDETERAADILRAGGLVVFPTETVYGLGANALDAAACARIFEAKGRPADNPLIVHLAGIDRLSAVARCVPRIARLLFERFSPGPLTVILPRAACIPDVVTAGLDTVAIRIPSSPVARAIISGCGFPVAAPSANRSGCPSPTDFEAAWAHMAGRVEAIVRGAECEIGLESTIVRVSGRFVELLREGSVTREMLREAICGRGELSVEGGGSVEIRATADTAGAARSGPAVAPGTRHHHYRPEAELIAVEAGELSAALRAHGGPVTAALLLGGDARLPVQAELCRSFIFASVEHYARQLYRSLRACDRAGCATIVAELPAAEGIGRALRDRLLRAAAR